MGKKWRKLVCSEKVKDRIMIDCKEEFLKQHPEYEEAFITQNFLLNRISRYYLGMDQEEE